jgi:ankyrin repeat protein
VGSTFAAALLLEKSGDLLCKDNDGNTALELAIGGGHTDCALLLAKKMGVELTKRNISTLDCNAPVGQKSKACAIM